jgi:HMG (high mobility group) box
MRETLMGQELSFTEVAKVVGERWQTLWAKSREACEHQAEAARETYHAQIDEYRRTPQYEAYQRYLKEFKAKHATPRGLLFKGKLTRPLHHRCVTGGGGTEGKRSKLETGTSTSSSSNTHDQDERTLDERISSAQPDAFAGNR